jgi:ribosomal protein S1
MTDYESDETRINLKSKCKAYGKRKEKISKYACGLGLRIEPLTSFLRASQFTLCQVRNKAQSPVTSQPVKSQVTDHQFTS